MAIVKHNQKRPQHIRDYFPRYWRNAIIVTALFACVTTIMIGGVLVLTGISAATPQYWLVVVATFCIVAALGIVGVTILVMPLRDITSAIASAAGERPPYPLANPNTERYARTGFKPLLQFIYDSSAKESGASPHATTDALLTSALDLVSTGVVLMDKNGTIIYANKAAPVAMNADERMRLQLHFDEAVGPTFSGWLDNCRKNAVHAQQIWERVSDAAVGAENRRIFGVTATYEKDSATEVVVMAHDETHIFKPEDDDLDFIAFAAHELRGPITVIRGYLDSLDEELSKNIRPDQREILQRLIVSANRLSGYINNILNASKFDHQHMKLHLQRDTINDIYQTVKDDMELRAESQHRKLTVQLPKDLPDIAADRSSLSEVLSNLIDNAIKYSHEDSEITVTGATDGDVVKISVADSGIGIPQSVIDNLFHKFYRSHRSRETVAGTGMGLYLCRLIIESHGGTIGVTSREGKGSVFTFAVPTYDSLARTLQKNDSSNAGLITTDASWIKNHEKYTS